MAATLLCENSPSCTTVLHDTICTPMLCTHHLRCIRVPILCQCRPYTVLVASEGTLQLMRVYGAPLIGMDTKYDLNLARFSTLTACCSDLAYKGRLVFPGVVSNEKHDTLHRCLEVCSSVCSSLPRGTYVAPLDFLCRSVQRLTWKGEPSKAAE